jgi:uncharacterized membrane protein YkgB
VVRPYCVPLLRLSLGLVFLWFGVLKVIGASPVTDLVAGTMPWFDPSWFVPLLGIIESGLGVALIAGRWLPAVGALLTAHLAGTFLVLLMQPYAAFQHGDVLLLTTDGEFVMKNLVLLSAALVVACWSTETRATVAVPRTAAVIPRQRGGETAQRGDEAAADTRGC